MSFLFSFGVLLEASSVFRVVSFSLRIIKFQNQLCFCVTRCPHQLGTHALRGLSLTTCVEFLNVFSEL